MDYPEIDRLMDEAYKLWQDHENDNPSKRWDQEDFYRHVMMDLSGFHALACVLGNLNYQVENGGFVQYLDNGYAEAAEWFMRSAFDNLDTEATKRVSELVGRFYSRLRWYKLLDENDDCSNYFNDLDEAFYKVNEQFMADLEAYFVLKVGGNA